MNVESEPAMARIVNPEHIVLKHCFEAAMEVAQFCARRLQVRGLASEVDGTEDFELFVEEEYRSAATRVIGRPVAVQRENQVMRDDLATFALRISR